MSNKIEINGTKHTSRRSFLKTSSAAVASSALVSGLNIARSAHAAGNDTLKVGLVGCGGRGTGAASQALGTAGPVKLWAMGDLFDDKIEISLNGLNKKLNSIQEEKNNSKDNAVIDVPSERQFTGFDAYKRVIDSGVDVVILTTQPHFRPVHFEYAVKQGKHVFMEKPVATDAPGVRQVLAANEEAKKKNLKIGVGLHKHHDLRYQETVKRIKDGDVGDLVYMRCYYNSSGARPPFIRKPGMTEMAYQLRVLYYFTWISGDHIVEQHIHNIDACNWLKGEYPVTVQGQGGRQVRTGQEYGDIFDHHFVEFAYEDGTRMFSQCRQIPGCWNNDDEHAYGTKGHANLSSGKIDGVDKWSFRGRVANPYQVEHDVLFDAIRNDKAHNEAEYGAKSTMTAIMGRMATYSGKTVKWEEAINSDLSLAPDAYTWDAKPSTLPDENGRYAIAVPGVTKSW